MENKKIEECSLSIIKRLPQICKPNQFMVAYFIINEMAIKKMDRVKIYRGKLADDCNMSERNITRITNSLNDVGIIQKDFIGDAEKAKTFNYYRLNWQKIDEFLARIDEEDDVSLPELSHLENKRNIEYKNKRNIEKIELYNNKNNIEEKEKIDTNDYFQEFAKNVDETLRGENDNDLINKRVEISNKLNNKRIELGGKLYNRCQSYLNRKYEEAVASTM